ASTVRQNQECRQPVAWLSCQSSGLQVSRPYNVKTNFISEDDPLDKSSNIDCPCSKRASETKDAIGKVFSARIDIERSKSFSPYAYDPLISISRVTTDRPSSSVGSPPRPIQTTVPPRAAQATVFARQSGCPTASTAKSTPRPSVHSRI